MRKGRQEADREQAGEAWQETDLVFTSGYGTPYEPRNFNRQFAARCRKAEVRYIRVHDTRRTCASLLVALDVHPRVAMQILRHSQIAMTMEVYSEVPSARPAARSSAWASSSIARVAVLPCCTGQQRGQLQDR